MTLHLTARDIDAVVTDEVALASARDAVRAEADGETVTVPRIDMPTPDGFLRVMPGCFRGIGGMKTMSVVRGVGNRYLLTVYDLADGRVLALLDADEVTRLRTAATTTVAAEVLLAGSVPQRLGLLGTGFEAAGHLRGLARRFPLEEVHVYSRDPARRTRFASTMSDELAIAVVPVATPEAAVRDAPLVCLATKNAEPVVDGDAFHDGAVVLSIGSTRPDLRELDDRAFARATSVLVDSIPGVLAESGDVRSALETGVLVEAQLLAMSNERTGGPVKSGTPALRVFKSVGTALQDLALAASIIEIAEVRGYGRELGDLAELKRGTDKSRSAAAVHE